MKQLRIFSLISCFVMILYFLIFSFPCISVAQETRQENIKNCISRCTYNRQVCFNINADKKACEVEFQNCVDICNSEDDSPSPTPQEKNSTMNTNPR